MGLFSIGDTIDDAVDIVEPVIYSPPPLETTEDKSEAPCFTFEYDRAECFKIGSHEDPCFVFDSYGGDYNPDDKYDPEEPDVIADPIDDEIAISVGGIEPSIFVAGLLTKVLYIIDITNEGQDHAYFRIMAFNTNTEKGIIKSVAPIPFSSSYLDSVVPSGESSAVATTVGTKFVEGNHIYFSVSSGATYRLFKYDMITNGHVLTTHLVSETERMLRWDDTYISSFDAILDGAYGDVSFTLPINLVNQTNPDGIPQIKMEEKTAYTQELIDNNDSFRDHCTFGWDTNPTSFSGYCYTGNPNDLRSIDFNIGNRRYGHTRVSNLKDGSTSTAISFSHDNRYAQGDYTIKDKIGDMIVCGAGLLLNAKRGKVTGNVLGNYTVIPDCWYTEDPSDLIPISGSPFFTTNLSGYQTRVEGDVMIVEAGRSENGNIALINFATKKVGYMSMTSWYDNGVEVGINESSDGGYFDYVLSLKTVEFT